MDRAPLLGHGIPRGPHDATLEGHRRVRLETTVENVRVKVLRGTTVAPI
jgi:hypothetical protein